MRILAKLTNGNEIVAEFTKVKKFGAFARGVANGSQRFNVWAGGEETLPNGERVQKRSREIIFPSAIFSLTEVDANDQPVAHVQRGERGTFTVPVPRPENIPVEVQDGVEYPKHRDTTNFRDFIYTRFPTGEGDAGEKWYVDGRGEYAEVNEWNEPRDDEDSDILRDDDDEDGDEPF